MDKIKRFLSILLAVLILLSLVPLSNFGIEAKAFAYNATAAADYAKTYWSSYNSAYRNYYPADCCNFVSQCLAAGGLEMTGGWYYNSSTQSQSWTWCPSLRTYLMQNLGCEEIKQPSAGEIDVGDVLVYGSGYGHVAICVDVINGTPWICAHTSDRHTSSWKLNYSTYAVIKMNGTRPAYDIDNSFPYPFLCRTISTSNVDCYNSVNGSWAGEIYPDDDCIIEAVYTNGWIKCSCPWNNGTYKTVYVPKSAFINSSSSAVMMTAPKYATTYLRVGDSSDWGWIDAGDTIYKVAVSGNMTQVIYPTGSNWRCGWVKTSDLTISEVTGYAINLENGSENGKFYDSNIAKITIIPKVNNREAYESEINSIVLKAKFPDGSIVTKDLGKNKEYTFYIGGNGDAAGGTYTFWASVSTQYGSCDGSVESGSVSLTLSKLSFTNGSFDDDVVYRRIRFKELDTYLTVDADDNVVSYERTDSTSSNQSQIWKIKKNTDGTCTIETLKNGKVLDVCDAIYAQGINVIAYTAQNSDNQKWKLSKDSAGEWFIRAAKSNSAVLDVEHGSVANGANVQIWTYNGAEAQKVTFETPYRVTYNANGGSGTPSTQYKDYNASISLSSTKPTRSGYTFLGWATSSSATSASYSAGASYSSNADLTLYAVWKKNTTYTLSYNANGGSGAPSSQTGSASYTIPSTEPTKTGYTFLGWATSSDAKTVDYIPGDTISISANKTLYAVWKKVFYGDVNNNGIVNESDITQMGKILSGSVSADSLTKLKGDLNGSGEIDDADLLILSQFCKKIIDTFPVEDMFLLAEFSLTKNTYAPGETIKASDFTVYYTNYEYHRVNTGFTISPTVATGSGKQKVTATLGDWTSYIYITVSEPATYTLTYNANGGSNAPSSQTGATSYTISSTVPTRFGYTFLGWSTSSSATSASYKPGNSISLSGATTLYAVWKSATTMSAGSSYTASVGFANQEVYYSFTPTASGEYVFESTGSLDPKIEVFNSSGTSLGSDDDSSDEGTNFKLKLNLTAGTKYYIKVRAYNNYTGSTSFNVKRVTYTLTYNANGGSNAPSSQTGATSYTISSTVPTRFGYKFLGWSKSSSATSATYVAGNSITLTSSTTLYAVWQNNTSSMSVNSSNSAQISTAGEMKYYTYTPSTSGTYVIYSTGSDDTKVHLYNTSGTELTNNDDGGTDRNFRLQYDLTSGTKYVFGVRYYSSSKTGTIPFKFGKVYTISYNANNGSNAPSAQKKDYGTSITLSSSIPTRSGYVFKGWATSSTATSATYQPGSTYSTEADVTLYAVWHAHSYSSTVTKSATCTTTGTRTYTCKGCSDSYTETIAATGHTWTAATCTAAKTCSVCKTTDGAALGHSYTSKVTKAATCTVAGVKTFTCSKCSHSYTESIPATGHSWTAATCTAAKTCSVCKATDGAALGHSYTSKVTKAATCTAAGVKTFTCSKCSNSYTESIAATGHKWTAATCTAAKTCSVCKTTDGAALGHSYTSKVTKAATCTVAGVKTFTCSKCSHSYTESIPATGHSWTAATCTAAKTCSVCKATDGAALGHSYTSKVTKAATCTAAGVKTFTCSKCSNSYTESIPATGHTPGAAATCTTNQTCTVCDAILNAKLGHTVGNAVMENKTEATCTEAGSYDMVVYCATCGEKLSTTAYTISATGHTPGAAATCTTDQTCTVCGEVLTEKEGHDYNAVVTAPTCESDGYTTYTCTVCGDSYAADTVSASGHAEEIIPAVDATCTQSGLTQGTRCAVCGEILVAQTEIPATEHTDVDADGFCDHCNAAMGDSFMLGDVNGDGQITSLDARAALRASVGLDVLTELQTKAADIDKNGVITSLDARSILRCSVGLEVLQ